MIATMLFVPGDRPDRIAKAVASGADCVVVDLEDAVAASAKEEGRAGAVTGIAGLQTACLLAVRVNSYASGALEADVQALAGIWARLDFVVLPMVPDAATIATVDRILEHADTIAGSATQLIPLIETADAVLNAREIAHASRRIHTLTFGPADLARELHLTPTADGTELLFARSTVRLAAASAGLAAPIDGPWLQLDDELGLRRSAEQAHRLGFGGKQVIHPAQLSAVTAAFAPSAQELAWALEVHSAFTEAERDGVSSIRTTSGEFVDYPIALRAREMLTRANKHPCEAPSHSKERTT